MTITSSPAPGRRSPSLARELPAERASSVEPGGYSRGAMGATANRDEAAITGARAGETFERAALTAGERPAPRGRRLYRTLSLALRWVRWWARLEVRGLEVLPRSGPVLVVCNHDSWLEPLALAEAMMWGDRYARFLAKASLWKLKPLAWVLDAIGQIPIRRGEGDTGALEAAVAALGRGEAVAIFPEGTYSRGKELRARTGVARLARARPEVPVVLAAVEGGTVLTHFRGRPRVKVELFSPAGGRAGEQEPLGELAQRWLDEIRERVPPTA